ncbi:hypothetical protein ACLBWX_14435 [Methylobacterium sp. M6A4_1b]
MNGRREGRRFGARTGLVSRPDAIRAAGNAALGTLRADGIDLPSRHRIDAAANRSGIDGA